MAVATDHDLIGPDFAGNAGQRFGDVPVFQRHGQIDAAALVTLDLGVKDGGFRAAEFFVPALMSLFKFGWRQE